MFACLLCVCDVRLCARSLAICCWKITWWNIWIACKWKSVFLCLIFRHLISTQHQYNGLQYRATTQQMRWNKKRHQEENREKGTDKKTHEWRTTKRNKIIHFVCSFTVVWNDDSMDLLTFHSPFPLSMRTIYMNVCGCVCVGYTLHYNILYLIPSFFCIFFSRKFMDINILAMK